jgi:hypothetical protein
MENTVENEIVEVLKDNKDIRVTFTKSDGSTRILNGTWNEDVAGLPSDEGESTEHVYNDLIKIFDINISAWRSFKPSRVISWEVI